MIEVQQEQDNELSHMNECCRNVYSMDDSTRVYRYSSDTPVGVHSRPHLNKDVGIHFPYEERFIRVSNAAQSWNWRVLRTHPGTDGLLRPLPWTVNDNECMTWLNEWIMPTKLFMDSTSNTHHRHFIISGVTRHHITNILIIHKHKQ